jgi:mannose/cellobiose epimerase-like protein (N-acyl-D-glucosamine 2-epimerase family)
MTENPIDFTFSDLVAGYVVDVGDGGFRLRTGEGRVVAARLADNTTSSITRNLGEDYRDTTGRTAELLEPGRHLHAYGIYYPEADGTRFVAEHLHFPDDVDGRPVFERVGWWVAQAREVADFYLRGQFPDGVPDWRGYRTKLTLAGTRTPDYVSPDHRQETDTISRLVYGLATTYLLTGEDRFLDAAETGVEYLREHMRVLDTENDIVYWYHGIDVTPAGTRRIYASHFGDDYDAIPIYEQIYALAGPTQTYRVTGDSRIAADLDRTIALFRRHFADPEQGGYFSHLDPITLDPLAPGLGDNRGRKNWNSIGDHAPAYLINAYLATGRADLAEFLAETARTIARRFPDDEHSPFVQERFHADWSADRSWGWQQDRAVVGHNLKIAWNLTRINNLSPEPEHVALAGKIARTMPAAGGDLRRGGWYDVVERVREPGSRFHRFAWHDRKAWWQQEQAILAYLVLGGTFGDPEDLRLARESQAFYNAFFLDHDDGGVYFNVLADGVPYLVGTERLKGSHSMSGYHSIELCYLAAVYTGLLITREPLRLHFRPGPDAFPDGVLRVAPDLLPPGSVRLSHVWIDDRPHHDYDADALTVRLPERDRPIRVRVRLVPEGLPHDTNVDVVGDVATVSCAGVLDGTALADFRDALAEALAAPVRRVELDLRAVTRMAQPAVNELLRTAAGARTDTGLVVTAAEPLRTTLRDAGLDVATEAP